MVSRPLVAGGLAGLAMGDPVNGIWAGLFLELLTVGQLPVGAARVWDAGPAAVVAAAGHLSAPAPGAASLVVAVGLSTLVGWAGGWSIHLQRRINARIAAPLARERARPSAVAGRQLLAMGLDFGRAALVTLIGVLLVTGAAGRLDVTAGIERLAVWTLVAVAALVIGATVRVLSPGPGVRIAFGGAALGALGLWWWLA